MDQILYSALLQLFVKLFAEVVEEAVLHAVYNGRFYEKEMEAVAA